MVICIGAEVGRFENDKKALVDGATTNKPTMGMNKKKLASQQHNQLINHNVLHLFARWLYIVTLYTLSLHDE